MTVSAALSRAREVNTGWAWFSLAVVGALACVLFGEVLVDLAVEWWTQPEASYGMVIPPFALYVVYLQRREILAIPARSERWGLGIIALSCCVFLTGKLASEFFLTRISFVLLLAGLVATFTGFARLRALAFPLILLATMVPPPALVYNAAAAPLQLFASRIATELAQMVGISMYRDGNIIHLASISLGVAEACSGLHSLMALMVAALLLGFLEDASFPAKVMVVLLSIPLAIAVNVMRVTGTAILADYQPELAMGYYHSFSGWLVFLLGFGLLWLLAKGVFRLSGWRA
jgi:exosortase